MAEALPNKRCSWDKDRPECSLTWSLQALLARHEAYIADTQAELAQRRESVANLETKNEQLRLENTRVVADNKALLSRLEAINNSVDESDARITALTSTLRSTELETQRLRVLAARTETLEGQLTRLEIEQDRLWNTLETTAEEERVASRGWRESQRMVLDLQSQMEMIENEAKTERLRLEETNQRSEWQRDVPTLQKRANSNETLRANGKDAVTSFVRELLEDNAKLQLSAVELEGCLVRSQEESERLRGQQEVANPGDEVQVRSKYQQSNLSLELTERDMLRELHVHNHYYGPSNNPARGSHPVNPRYQSRRQAPRLLNSDGRQRDKRWSGESNYSRKSLPPISGLSSPKSASYCESTILEHTSEGDLETRPTSPESDWSPAMKPVQPSSQPAAPSFQSLSTAAHEPTSETSLNPSPWLDNSAQSPMESHCVEIGSMEPDAGPYRALTSLHQDSSSQPIQLRRIPSTSSLYSVSGMDIHSSMPSRRPNMTPASLRTQSFVTDKHKKPVLTATNASASSASRLVGHGVGQTNRNGSNSRVSEGQNNGYTPLVDTFGHRVGGWLSGRLGSASASNLKQTKTSDEASATCETRPSARTQLQSVATKDGSRTESKPSKTLRRSGRSVMTSALDTEALEESLSEDKQGNG